VAKAPLTLGLYWLSSNLFTAIEQICYSLYMKRKCLN
jgi:membrane protein insertase Oxa1/YidC/SpoIIIJ